MYIQSTKQFNDAIAQPQELARRVHEGEVITLDVTKIEASVVSNVAAAGRAHLLTNVPVEIRLPEDLSDENRAQTMSDIYTALADAQKREVKMIKAKNAKPTEFCVSSTAGNATIGLGAGYGAGLALQSILDIGKTSNSPYWGTLCIGLGALGAALGADQANGKIVLTTAKGVVSVFKEAVS